MDVDASGEVVLSWAPDVAVEDGRVSVPAAQRGGRPRLTAVGGRWQDLPMDAVAERYRRLSRRMTERIAAIPEDAWSSPTPVRGVDRA